jgi:hypothetical protein
MKKLIAVGIVTVLAIGLSGCSWFQPAEQPAVTETPTDVTEPIEEKCYKNYEKDEVKFEYPCDWETDVKGEETWSAVGTVVAPGGKASFTYPAPDFGLHEMELVEESMTTINGNDYSTKKFEGNQQTIVIVDMGTALSEYGYNLMLAYENSTYEEELNHILSTFEF